MPLKTYGVKIFENQCINRCRTQFLFHFLIFQKFQFAITDVNEHAPTFSQNEFTYTVPAPLMPQSDLSRYGPTIIVEDLDFSNKDVTFTIDPNDFDIRTTVNKKKYTAVFYTRNVMLMTQSMEYTLTATVSIYKCLLFYSIKSITVVPYRKFIMGNQICVIISISL